MWYLCSLRPRWLGAILLGLLFRYTAGWILVQSPLSPLASNHRVPKFTAQTIDFNAKDRHNLPRLHSFPSDGEYIGNSNKQKTRKPWHRAITRLLRWRRDHDDDATSIATDGRSSRLRMTHWDQDQDTTSSTLFKTESSTSTAASTLLEPSPLPLSGNDTDDTAFIRDNFNTLTPEDLFLTQELQDSHLLAAKTSPAIAKSPKTSPKTSPKPPSTNFEGGPLLIKWARLWFQNFLEGVIRRISVVPPQGLQVLAAPRGILPLVRRGQLRCDTKVKFDRVVFPNIRLSGGGTLEAKRLVLNLMAFAAPLVNRAPRYARAFQIHAHNCTLTQDDLLESSCIRNGLARLLVRILGNAGVTTAKVQVTQVEILPSNKISCSGVATTAFGSRTPFEVRSGIGTTSRGHVLTFPGLEVSLQPMMGVFMPVVPDISLDVGHNARLSNVALDVRRRRVTVDASVTVTPEHTRILKNYSQPSDSFLAPYTFDVGRWVTRIGNFAN